MTKYTYQTNLGIKASLLYKPASNNVLVPPAIQVNKGPGQYLRKNVFYLMDFSVTISQLSTSLNAHIAYWMKAAGK